MTVSKTALTVTSVALAMMFGGGAYLLANMNVFAKSYIERSATETLGVPVSIGSLEIALKDRKAHAKNLKIGNPDGFKGPHAVLVPDINVTLGGLSKELVSIKDVEVSQAEVYLEVKDNTTNLAVIQNRARKAPADDVGAQAIKVIISKLSLMNAKINPVIVLFTDQNLEPIILPSIVMTDIGEKENGVLANEAIAQIWMHFAQKLNSEAARQGLLQGLSPEALQQMGVSDIQRFKQNLHENVQEKLDAVGEKIDHLLND